MKAGDVMLPIRSFLVPGDGMSESLIGKAKGRKVSDLMTVPVVVVHNDHLLMECVDQSSTIPVVDYDDLPVGMFHEGDIFSAVSGSLVGGR